MAGRVIAELAIVPLGTGSTSLSRWVRIAEKVIAGSGLEHTLTPMGTCVQGELAEIFHVVQQAHEALAAAGAQRISTQVKIDDRRDKDRVMQDKIDAVLKRD
ncbi:MAG: MTH1187 family thiamine-binding protein [bacterium]